MEQTCETCGNFKDCLKFKSVYYSTGKCDNWIELKLPLIIYDYRIDYTDVNI